MIACGRFRADGTATQRVVCADRKPDGSRRGAICPAFLLSVLLPIEGPSVRRSHSRVCGLKRFCHFSDYNKALILQNEALLSFFRPYRSPEFGWCPFV